MTRDYYESTAPIRVKGGIRADAGRKASANSNWWAQRWTQTLEEFQMGTRLSRGRSYARQGQIISINIDKGAVTAQVQGSAPTPYRVLIQVKTISPQKWDALRESMADQPIIAATLLSGQMPENIEDCFRALNLSMFPQRRADLKTKCSCPDSSNPCKHIAAVYLLLGQEFNRDPFLILRLRGLDRQDLLGPDLRQSAQALENRPEPRTPLPPDPEEFWTDPIPELREASQASPTAPPEQDAPLPRQLGRFPLWQGTQEFIPALQDIYRQAARQAAGM